nr:AMP-binding protein [Lautropia sp.]
TLVRDLRRMAGGAGTSLFSVLAGGFAALLARLSGQDDIVIGVPSAGQSRCGMDSLVGHCVNLLPIRFQLTLGQTAAELVAGTKDLLLDALEHQQYTFGTLLQKLQIPRDASRVPLVGVMFNLDQPFELDCLGSAGVRLEPMPVPRHFEAFELFLNISQSAAGLRLECQFNTDLFTARTVRRWLAGYETLLRGILQTPQSPLKDIQALDAEQSQTLARWNHTGLDHDRNRLVQDLIGAQALSAPRRTALAAAGKTLTYGALWSRSNRLAWALRARGLARGKLVGLCLERGFEMVVAQLAILKAGAAYVPLDPGYPADRLAYMVQDAGLAAVVTKSSLAISARASPISTGI